MCALFCLTYLSEETRVEFVPFCRFQVSLLQNGRLAEYINRCANVKIPALRQKHQQRKLRLRLRSGVVDFTYGKLCCVAFVSTVELFDVVLGVLDDNLVGLPIKAEHNHDVVLLTVLYPPRGELQTFDLI